jgi:transposase
VAEKRAMLGSLPVVAGYIKRSGLAGIVDKVCPSAPQAGIRHADAVVALVANRLTASCPLYRVEEWAADYAIEAILGIAPDLVNDDRLAEALDAVAESADDIEAGMALHLQSRLGVDLLAVHLDWTKVIFHGLYEAQNPDFAMVMMGAPSATVPVGTKTMNCEMAVVDTVPLRFKSHSGNTADSTTVISAFEWIRQVAPARRVVMVGDTKLFTQANELSILVEGCHLIAPMPWSAVLEREMSALPDDGWHLLDYMSERESLRPKRDQRRFWGQEQDITVRAPIDKDGKLVTGNKRGKVAEYRTFVVRKVFIRSEEEVQAARASRGKRMERTEMELRQLKANVRYYKTADQLANKIAKILANRKLTKFYHFEVLRSADPEDPRPIKLSFRRLDAAVAEAERNDGIYVLRATLPRSDMSTNAVLAEFKKQNRLESRFSDYKGPLAVSPVYLKSNKRAVGLLLIVMLALQIYALIEHDIRATLKDQGGKMAGLYPEGRLSRPTTRQILRVFTNYGASQMRIRGQLVWVLDPLTSVQAEILTRLGLDLPAP